MPADIFTTEHAGEFELDPRPADVLVFGSHLAFGSVGLNAGLPIYDEAGLRCAAVPTVVLSNLPHYPSVQAIDVPADWITRSLDHLTAAGALRSVRAVAVGYLAAPAQAHAIAGWYRSLDPADRPPLVLDPTFGDSDVGFYTDPAVAPALAESLVDLADVITPNTFELTHLTGGSEPTPRAEVVDRARELLATPGARAIVTGLDAGGMIDNLIVDANSDAVVSGPRLATRAKGLGDTFTAALTVALLAEEPITVAVEHAAACVRAAIERRETPH